MNSIHGHNPLSVIVGLLLTVVACGGSGSTNPETVIVSAAASLTDAFGEMESAFEEANPDLDVTLNLSGSSSLRVQILEGAPVDVFASADLSNMQQVVDAGTAESSQIFARNRLTIAVPPGNPAGVTGLAAFADESLLIGLCAEAVPCGAFARETLEKAGVVPVVDSNEPDVRALLTKIEAGELDAGITYVTDVVSADGSVDGIVIPSDDDVVTEYPIAVLADAPNAGPAHRFVEFVLSDDGLDILADHGFAAP